MEGPLPGGTTFLIAVSPAPGKYDFGKFTFLIWTYIMKYVQNVTEIKLEEKSVTLQDSSSKYSFIWYH
jgi:hypothetical protein